MPKLKLYILAIFLISLNKISYTQTTHIIEIRNFFFSPAEPVVQVGDTVRWVNIQGTHNVVADDNSFTSGSPASGNWTYQYVFTSEGIKPYYCSLHGGPGGSGMAAVIIVTAATDVKTENTSINNFELQQNYPNPFNPSTKIRYSIPDVGSGLAQTVLKVYDVLGNEVATLVNEGKPAGVYEVTFDASELSSGIYFYRIAIHLDKLSTGAFTETRKMILLR
jgi:plastocyanin